MVTSLIAAGTMIVPLVVQWDSANKVIATVAAVAAVVAIGVALWVAVPKRTASSVRVTGTGDAVAHGMGSANTGVQRGAGSGPLGHIEVDETGNADARSGSDANTGVRLGDGR